MACTIVIAFTLLSSISSFADSTTTYDYDDINRKVTVTHGTPGGGGGGNYSISGTISGLGGSIATVTLSGAASATTSTDGSGNYGFTGLSNGNYTVAPSLSGYTFSPTNRSVTVSGANVTGQNFTATQGGGGGSYSISGAVTSGGSGLAGVTMTLSGAASLTISTDSSGSYVFTGLANGNYTVTPSLSGHAFSPASRSVTINGANVAGQNFTEGATYRITGTVTSGGRALTNVLLTLTGPITLQALSYSAGYIFSGVPNGTYTITPRRAGYTFTPSTITVTVSGADVTGQNFTATGDTTYRIEGTVRTSGGSALPGVSMTLSGTATGTTTTDAAGAYSFQGLVSGTYTVTPSKAGYTFTPPSTTVTITRLDQSGQDFTATGGGSYNIYGAVATSGGSGLAEVTITLSGTAAGTTITDSSGEYGLTGLVNGTYTITPSLSGYTFSPTSRPVTINSGNVTGQNFTGTEIGGGETYSISGSVTVSGGGALAGVTMTLSGAASGTTTSDSSGNYTFNGLPNGSYTVTPALAGYTFVPTARSVTVNWANVANQNFLGTAGGSSAFIISGTVSSNGSPLSGVIVNMSGSLIKSTSTNSSGDYQFGGLRNGTYRLTPNKTGYTFTPATRSVTVSGGDVTNQDFAASP
ncbi:MAG: carboxypeptidase regulatory-like domain-containing protein [Nitrospirae bacterium]|nr:carboxypeptidase regulatory-like domain-containing protein [Nitrospirota bacterium]